MPTTKIAHKVILVFCVLTLFLQQKAVAQVVIGTPNLGFSQACASNTFNSYSTTFVFSPENALNSSNQFTIELSDSEGDFEESVVIFTSNPGEITNSPATVNFSLPTTTAGESYRIRIKSSSPAATSAPSASFAAYYKIQDSPFSINNLVSTGAYCTGGSYLLTIDNPGTGLNDSPLQYPSLTFNWYRETSPTTSEFIAEGPSLIVNQEGTYFVETNYGTCTSDSFSNRVTISEVSSGQAEAGIASSLGNPFCPEQGMTTLSTLGGISYQWFKDGELINGATSQQYQTNETGVFSVQVDLGSCFASGSIDLFSELFDADINVPDVNWIEEGESLFIEVSNNAIAPQYEWYLNDTLISEATEATYDATEFGTYRIEVLETNGCQGTREFIIELNEAIDQFPDVANIPNVISPNGDGINDTWVLPQALVTGTNTNIMIMTNRGKVIFQTDDYQNDWPQNNLNLTSINQVYYYIITTSNNQTKKGSITVVK
ncbi:gliding motility-associated C-terminal domain-containing protein [Psychroserpens sp.]|uniref:T9SS type B sorting domain-containing protein n=1 Tax=Psychroserpens sp. TaxID=2020870 RepID=UPI001B1EC3E5|nr:gliding motility-associated C-terminal domain-containing protein [Psychroserpens sp.]MBO6606393.1 gliding motility-associated C-terminal domain-containing protein [Psychroserpens sp.]MBO6653097.1 gliding motility-associated C-terminal domain-containing protein [Psychroserpens sp.]MBO6680875.1 gliding motility-associated C-terminal domain-containing protein [Psychroserpens sp.]MBO6750167.1 gliding motility-associated C-terminal domain-containing protein [Psychroserpens sp.]MBO6914648.1 glidi